MQGPELDIPREFWATTGVGLALTAPLLLLMLRKHKAIRRWSMPARVWLAIAAWLLTLANVLVFPFCELNRVNSDVRGSSKPLPGRLPFVHDHFRRTIGVSSRYN